MNSIQKQGSGGTMEEKSWARTNFSKEVFLQNKEACPKMHEAIFL